MEQISRVKKYEKLRSDIEKTEANQSDAQAAILDITKPKQTQNEYVPTHEKESVFLEKDKSDTLDETFKNEYLDSFIQEVRDYNIKKGVREYEDTKLDILQQLTNKNRERRANYVEKIEEEPRDMSQETMEISKQVINLLNEDETIDSKSEMNQEVEMVSIPTIDADFGSIRDEQTELQKMSLETDNRRINSELEARIASLESQLVETTQQLKVQNFNDDDFTSFSKRELVEETQKLKVQMDEYKEELNDLNSGVDSNNRLLNIIITILIVALLAVIGVVVYWLVTGGII